MPLSAIREVQSNNDFSNKKMGSYLRSVRSHFGSRSIEPGAEKALQSDSKLVEDFFRTESYDFVVTDPDDAKKTIILSKTGVVCHDVPNLSKFITEKRGFANKIKLQ